MDIIKICLRLGANINDVDCIGQTPLFYAISHCQANEIVPLLIEAGWLGPVPHLSFISHLFQVL